jgi:hypothetical protein
MNLVRLNHNLLSSFLGQIYVGLCFFNYKLETGTCMKFGGKTAAKSPAV